jgi:MurNAc alpha-1-phosphate uridylyltransferase
VAPYLFAGIQLLHRRAFDGTDEGKFSLNRVYDRAESAGRLHAIVHDGEWFHVGTPDGLAATRARLASHRIER